MSKNAQAATWLRTSASGGFNSTTGAGVVRGGTTPPGTPAAPTVTGATSNSVTLNAVQPAAGSAAIAGANWYRNGVKANVTPVPFGSWTDAPLAQLTAYTYTVTAVDVGSNEGLASPSVVCTTTSAIGDFFPNGIHVSDPYSGYQTWYVDPTYGNNATTPGSSGGVTGQYAAGHVYADIGNALADVFYATGLNGGQRRVVVRSSAAWNGGSTARYVYTPPPQPGWYPPFGSATIGSVPAFNYVLQGDPSSNVLPLIEGGYNGQVSGSVPTTFLCLGNKGGSLQVSNPITGFTVRKFECQNFTGNCIYTFVGSNGNSGVPNSSYLMAEYCYAHDFYYPDSHPSGITFFSCSSNQAVNNITIQNCKFANFGLRTGQAYGVGQSTSGGNYSLNNACFETYGSNNVTIKNNLFQNTLQAIFLKLAAYYPNHTDNLIVANNVAVNCEALLAQFGASGSGTLGMYGSSNARVTGNLVYGTHPAYNALAYNTSGGIYPGFQGAGVLWANNTTGEDVYGNEFGWQGATGVVMRDNVQLGSAGQSHFRTSEIDVQSEIVFSQLDYNVYYQPTGFWGFGYNSPALLSKYSTFARWQTASSVPRDGNGTVTGTPPPELAVIGDPDPHGRMLADLTDFTNIAARDYSIKAGSALLTASSTGGRVGFDPLNSGPGW